MKASPRARRSCQKWVRPVKEHEKILNCYLAFYVTARMGKEAGDTGTAEHLPSRIGCSLGIGSCVYKTFNRQLPTFLIFTDFSQRLG